MNDETKTDANPDEISGGLTRRATLQGAGAAVGATVVGACGP